MFFHFRSAASSPRYSRLPYLACAVASILLLGCSSFRERQENAQRLLNGATDQIVGSLEKAKEVKEDLTGTLSGVTETIQETVFELEDRMENLQEGIEKVVDAVESGQEGLEEVQGALNVSREDAVSP
jgi:methyl-accepting chemotaxis protein